MTKIICKWSGFHLWQQQDLNGLALTNTGHYCVVSILNGVVGLPNTKAQLLSADIRWAEAVNKIEGDGYRPDWSSCSCGSQVVMGNDWTDHTSMCDSLILPSPFGPKNNDGRIDCYRCGEKNRVAGGGQYNICSNIDCDWYER